MTSTTSKLRKPSLAVSRMSVIEDKDKLDDFEGDSENDCDDDDEAPQLRREDIDFLLTRTEFDEFEIREWFRSFIAVRI